MSFLHLTASREAWKSLTVAYWRKLQLHNVYQKHVMTVPVVISLVMKAVQSRDVWGKVHKWLPWLLMTDAALELAFEFADALTAADAVRQKKRIDCAVCEKAVAVTPCIWMKLITWPFDVERRHTWSCTNCTVTIIALILCRFSSFLNASGTRAVLFNSSESMLITSQHMLHCSLRYEINLNEGVSISLDNAKMQRSK